MTSPRFKDAAALKAESIALCGFENEKWRDRIEELKDECRNIAAQAKREKRELTGREVAQAAAYMAEATRIEEEPLPHAWTLDTPGGVEKSATYADQNGRPIQVLKPQERFADLPGRGPSLSLGRAIIGLATGKWRGAEAEKLAMAEGQNAAGGFLVPESFTARVIDYARAQTACIQAGAITVPWAGSDRMVMARVAADPTLEIKGENEELTERSMTFEPIAFDAHKIGCLIAMSRELADDASNAAALVEQVLGRALATKLDSLALTGSGTLNGLLNYTDVTSTDSIGAIAWADVHEAAVTVRNANFEPTGYISSPTIAGDLDLIQASTAGTWLGAPPSLANVPRFTTKNCPDANLFVGQWNQFVFALRQAAQIEVTTTGGDAFKKHQLLIKITWRGDVGCLNADAFHVLKGITT